MRSTLLVTIAASALSLALLGGANAAPRHELQGYDWGQHLDSAAGYGSAPRTAFRAPVNEDSGMSPGPGYSWGSSFGPGQ
jgi:hypothetical protein